jgi:signal transduction histidine kinase
MRMKIYAIKIWTREGLIIYSSNKALTGRWFSPQKNILDAAKGHISVEYNELDDDENEFERWSGFPLTEIYAPVRGEDGEVIAVAEFYERAEALNQTLIKAQMQSWLVTGSVCSFMILSLFWIVARGSKTIEDQKHALSDRVSQLTDLLRQNTQLRDRVQRASQLATEDNERFLRRLGSDIHDGPAQLISYSLLRLDALSSEGGASNVALQEDVITIRAALSDAMNDVRAICAGLCMPEVENLSLHDALLFVTREHEKRTRTAVSLGIEGVAIHVAHFVKICLCRFVQEGLNNAYRHAGGCGQSVAVRMHAQSIIVEVADQGPGISLQEERGDRIRLGLIGLCDRIESLGGSLEVLSQVGVGTRLIARLPTCTGGE